MVNADITADCFWSTGYFAIARSISFRPSAEIISDTTFSVPTDENPPRPSFAADLASCCCWFAGTLSAFACACRRDAAQLARDCMSAINLTEHDVLRADD